MDDLSAFDLSTIRRELRTGSRRAASSIGGMFLPLTPESK
jgi:hypothetical protein